MREKASGRKKKAAQQDAVGLSLSKMSLDEPQPTNEVPWDPVLLAKIFNDDEAILLPACIEMRKMFSVCSVELYDRAIGAGLIPRLAHLLKTSTNPAIVFEVCWILTNVSSGEERHTIVVVESGVLPVFIQFAAEHSSKDVKEQSIWAIGNIVGGSSKFRDLAIAGGALQAVVKSLNSAAGSMTFMRNATWTLSNLLRGKPKAVVTDLTVLHALNQLLHVADEEVLTDACWAISYWSDGPTQCIQEVINSGICARLIQLMLHQSPGVVTPALRAASNIVTGDDHQTQFMLDAGILPCLSVLINHPKKATRKESLWAISNIAAGNRRQIQALMEANVLPVIVKSCQHSDADFKKEAIWALSNVTAGGSHEQLKFLESVGGLSALCHILGETVPEKLLEVALEGIENFLRADKDKYFTNKVEECSGLNKIEELQRHSNQEVYERAVRLLETYFGAEQDEEASMQMDSMAVEPPQFQIAAPPPNFIGF